MKRTYYAPDLVSQTHDKTPCPQIYFSQTKNKTKQKQKQSETEAEGYGETVECHMKI